jgi:hypothetical protein
MEVGFPSWFRTDDVMTLGVAPSSSGNIPNAVII